MEQRFGSYDFYRTEWDATGPVTDDGSLSYRLTGAYQDTDSFRDFVFNERLLINPSLTWRPTEATTLTLEIEGVNQEFHSELGIPAIGDRPAPIPISRSYSDPGIASSTRYYVLVATDLIHHFNDAWTLRNRFLTLHGHYKDTQIFATPRSDNRTFDRGMWLQEGPDETYTTNLDLIGRFSLWGTRHEILVGTDYTLGYAGYHFVESADDPARAIDILDPGPNYGVPNPLFQNILDPTLIPRTYSVAKTEWWGVYFQDHITLWDKLHIVGGGRHDWADTGRGFGDSFAEGESALENSSPSIIRHDEAFSPRVGILYQPWTWLSVYGNWTTSFGANNGVSLTGQPHPPQRGEQYEAGLKTEWFDQRLNTTLAFYHLIKQNILTPDLSTPELFDTIAIGKARSRGIEFDMSGQIWDSLYLIGSYAWTDTRVTKNNSGLQGNRLYNAPEHAGSLWFKFDFTNYRPLNGLSLGFGAYFVGDRQGDAANTFILPNYTRLDAFAAYRWQLGPSTVTAQFNIRNLLDKKYYDNTDLDGGRTGIHPGEPLTAIGSIRVEY